MVKSWEPERLTLGDIHWKKEWQFFLSCILVPWFLIMPKLKYFNTYALVNFEYSLILTNLQITYFFEGTQNMYVNIS